MTKYRCTECNSEFDKPIEEEIPTWEFPLSSFAISGSGTLVTGGYTMVFCPVCYAGSEYLEVYKGWMPYDYE